MKNYEEALKPLTNQEFIDLFEYKSKYWNVTKDGLEHKVNGYFIANDRLLEPIWIAQLSQKTWIDMNDFIRTYFEVLNNLGIHKLDIHIY